MQIAETIRRISYSPSVCACIGRLGLRGFMQRLYALVWGNAGTVNLNLNNVEALFSAQTPFELRCVEGTWFSEREMLNAIQGRLNTGDTFLDVGSNLGIFTIFAAKAVGPQGTVVGCEPETNAHDHLQKNIEINQLRNVRLLKLALSDRRSMKKLLLGDSGAVSQSAHLSDADGPSEDVQTADYDSLIAEEGLPIPRVVKMDIEGHEYIALQGMRVALSSPSCVALFCEVHPSALPSGISTGDVVKLIESFGFEPISTRKRGAEFQVTATKPLTRTIIEKGHEAGMNVPDGR
jgi:FkbM family methyltransferase